MQRHIDGFEVILLDMHGTFMFGHDRFGEAEDFHRTYRALGGGLLDAEIVDRTIHACIRTMSALYADPGRFDRFVSVEEALGHDSGRRGPVWGERKRLVEVLAFHERGHVPTEYAECLRVLAKTHRLGLVSNVFAPKDGWLTVLREAGVLELFEATVFSSDGRSVKPSPRIFGKALNGLGVPPDAAVHVGDSLARDVAGAKGVGIGTVWIAGTADAEGPEPSPDAVIADLRQLPHLA